MSGGDNKNAAMIYFKHFPFPSNLIHFFIKVFSSSGKPKYNENEKNFFPTNQGRV